MTDKRIETLAEVAGQMTQAAMAGQGVGLNLLLAEMQALAVMMPGAGLVPQPPRSPEQILADEAATEADFDNMPV